MTPHYWNDATAHLARVCPTMKRLIARYEGECLKARGDGFYTLMRSVVGQQISVLAADAVWARLQKAVQPFTPIKLLCTNDTLLRECGLSGQKVTYARNVAEFYRGRSLGAEAWHNHSDAQVMDELTAIKGIGSWTAKMFMIFHLLRPDILPLKDLGVLKAINLLMVDAQQLQGKKWLSPEEYSAIAAPWAPYRTVATWYLWRALDPVPVAY